MSRESMGRGACEVFTLRRELTEWERLASMRWKFDRGEYAKLIVIGILPDGSEECVQVRWEDTEARPGTVPLYGALNRLLAMRERFDRGEYAAYIAVALDHRGRMERVSVGAPDRSRWPLVRAGGE